MKYSSKNKKKKKRYFTIFWRKESEKWKVKSEIWSNDHLAMQNPSNSKTKNSSYHYEMCLSVNESMDLDIRLKWRYYNDSLLKITNKPLSIVKYKTIRMKLTVITGFKVNLITHNRNRSEWN